MHFDVKADGSMDVDEDDTLLKQKKEEEEDDDVYDENDIAPVVVLTNDERDAVVYSVYAVPCDALITNLFDSGLNARLMGVSSDTAAIDLAAVKQYVCSSCGASERRVWFCVDDVIVCSSEEEFGVCETFVREERRHESVRFQRRTVGKLRHYEREFVGKDSRDMR